MIVAEAVEIVCDIAWDWTGDDLERVIEAIEIVKRLAEAAKLAGVVEL